MLGNFLGRRHQRGQSQRSAESLRNAELHLAIHGNHILKFGARVRVTQDTNYSSAGIQRHVCRFRRYHAYLNSSSPRNCRSSTGSPHASVTYYDFEPYIQDDWRVKPNITLSFGLRFETQNAIHDHGDLAPRLGFAWGVGGRSNPPKVVIRGGYGIFYNRFQVAQILQADRFNGITQQQFIVNNPTCFPGVDAPLTVPISDCGAPTSTASTTYQISPSLHAPYTMQGAVSVERQVTKSATVSATYLNSRGFDQFITINANAPYPGTPCYPGLRPTHRRQPLPLCVRRQFQAEPADREHQREGRHQSSAVRLLHARLRQQRYFRGLQLSRQTPTTSARITAAPRSMYAKGSFSAAASPSLILFRLSPFMVVSSGSPFNITSPID